MPDHGLEGFRRIAAGSEVNFDNPVWSAVLSVFDP